jgi:hypothetical protein
MMRASIFNTPELLRLGLGFLSLTIANTQLSFHIVSSRSVTEKQPMYPFFLLLLYISNTSGVSSPPA